MKCDGNEGLLNIPESSSITGASTLDSLELYACLSLGDTNPSAEIQSVYSKAAINWAKIYGYLLTDMWYNEL